MPAEPSRRAADEDERMRRPDARLQAISDLSVPYAREVVGRHEYDGAVQDLSPDGVRRALARLGGPSGTEAYRDPFDEALATSAESALRVRFGELELHRVNPLLHIENLDTSCYDRPYAAAEEREAARLEHLRCWPDAVGAAIESLDRVPAPVARATLPLTRRLASNLAGVVGGEVPEAGLALERLLAHLERAAEKGERSASLGAPALTRLLSSAEALEVDPVRLAEQAETERERMRGLLDEACRRIDPAATTTQTVKALQADHPRAEDLLPEAAALTEEAITWTAQRQLVPYEDGDCRVQPMPDSRHGPAEMVSAAPYEADTPALFYVNPRGPSASAEEQEQWLRVYFNRAFLPAITLHEVAPGHFCHGRALRRASSHVRRTLVSDSFLEGWAVYAEELALEQGFRDGDPRFAAGIALSALERAVRMAAVIGLHAGVMDEPEIARRFREDAFFDGPAARTAVERCTYVPTWGRYTWGKLAILDLRERARAAWGRDFSLRRFHSALLALGSPPLGLIAAALEQR